jgi:hypothetical protein
MRKDGSANISAKKEGLTHTEARRSFAIMVQQRGLKARAGQEASASVRAHGGAASGTCPCALT